MVAGDLNARVLPNNTGKKDHWLPKAKKWTKNLVLRGILYMHRTIHKTTSSSADNHTVSLIDDNQSDVKTITSTCQRQTPPPYQNE
jgi:hypothetical protein